MTVYQVEIVKNQGWRFAPIPARYLIARVPGDGSCLFHAFIVGTGCVPSNGTLTQTFRGWVGKLPSLPREIREQVQAGPTEWVDMEVYKYIAEALKVKIKISHLTYETKNGEPVGPVVFSEGVYSYGEQYPVEKEVHILFRDQEHHAYALLPRTVNSGLKPNEREIERIGEEGVEPFLRACIAARGNYTGSIESMREIEEAMRGALKEIRKPTFAEVTKGKRKATQASATDELEPYATPEQAAQEAKRIFEILGDDPSVTVPVGQMLEIMKGSGVTDTKARPLRRFMTEDQQTARILTKCRQGAYAAGRLPEVRRAEERAGLKKRGAIFEKEDTEKKGHTKQSTIAPGKAEPGGQPEEHPMEGREESKGKTKGPSAVENHDQARAGGERGPALQG